MRVEHCISTASYEGAREGTGEGTGEREVQGKVNRGEGSLVLI